MRNIVLSLSLVTMLGISGLSANETDSATPNLQKQDMEILFGANANDVNVVALSEKELKETQGEAIYLY